MLLFARTKYVLVLCSLLLSLGGCGGGGNSSSSGPPPVPPPTSEPKGYSITPLGLPAGFSYSSGGAINNRNQVEVLCMGNTFRSYFYDNGKLQDLGIPTGATSFSAGGLNDVGQIVGFSQTITASSTIQRALVYASGTFSDLGALGGQNSGINGNGINNSGSITGTAETADNVFHAFLYSNGKMNDLGVPPGFVSSEGLSINSQGDIVGDGTLLIQGQKQTHAVFYKAGIWADLGTLGGNYSSANSLNNNSQIVGVAEVQPGLPHAFLYENGKMQDITTLPQASYSDANCINNYGVVVGSVDTVASSLVAFVYRNGQMVNLNTQIPSSSGWRLISAVGINDAGFIVGNGNYRGQDQAFLLTPTF